MHHPLPRKRIGEVLVENGYVPQNALIQALQIQGATGRRLGQVLEELGCIQEKDIARVLAQQFQLRLVDDLGHRQIARDVLEWISCSLALEKLVIPFAREQNCLHLAMVDPLDFETIDKISFLNDLEVVPWVATSQDIYNAIRRHYFHIEELPASDDCHVLVVEHKDIVRATAVVALQKAGFNAQGAQDGPEALRKVMHFKPQLIVLETTLPQMDGFQVFKNLQNNRCTRNIPVIGFSPQCTIEEEERLLGMGFFDLLPQPLHPELLVARTRRAWRAHYGKKPQIQEPGSFFKVEGETGNADQPSRAPGCVPIEQLLNAIDELLRYNNCLPSSL